MQAKTVNRNKEQKEIEKRYLKYRHRGHLCQCYSSYSTAKESAYEYCRNLHKDLDELEYMSLSEYAILSYNAIVFTYGALYQKVNKQTGEIETWFLYCTKTKDETWRIK